MIVSQTYGYQYMTTLDNLAKLDLFKKQESRTNPYNKIRKDLRLVVEDINEQSPNDIAYVYSG